MTPEIKPIIIVDAFFHNDNCVRTFKNYLVSIKKTGLPIMLVTNSKFEQSLVDEVDYILYDNNNRLFKNNYSDVETIAMWYRDNHKYFSIAIKAFQRHGLSVLSNLYHSTNLALSLGYTHFFRIEYDCVVPSIENVKYIINETQEQNKKGYIYINQDKYICFQFWYFALDYFTKIFPRINSENDYVESKRAFSNDESFMIAEEFVLNLIRSSEGGFDNLVNKPASVIHTEFPGSSWNTLISPSESDLIVDGFISSVHRVGNWIEGIDPQYTPIDNSKFAIITWNCSSENHNKSIIKILRNNQEPQILEHELFNSNDNGVEVFDLTEENVEVQITMNDNETKSVIINKDNIHLVNNILILN
jgi:hypothetical protein